MPQAKDAKGEWKDIAFPITKEGREELSRVVLAAYSQEINQQHQQTAPQKSIPTQGYSRQDSSSYQKTTPHRNIR